MKIKVFRSLLLNNMVCLSATWVQARPPFPPPQTTGTASGQEQVWAGKHTSRRVSNLTSSPPRSCNLPLDLAAWELGQLTGFPGRARAPEGCRESGGKAQPPSGRGRGRKTPLFQMSGKSRGSLPLPHLGPFPEGILNVTGWKRLETAGEDIKCTFRSPDLLAGSRRGPGAGPCGPLGAPPWPCRRRPGCRLCSFRHGGGEAKTAGEVSCKELNL